MAVHVMDGRKDASRRVIPGVAIGKKLVNNGSGRLHPACFCLPLLTVKLIFRLPTSPASLLPDFMSSTNSHSITLWIQRLKSGQEDAATQLWDRYFDRLVALAKKKMRGVERRVTDEEDIAITAFQSLCNGASKGRFNELQNRDDLWMLLVAITTHKAIDQARRQTTLKRGDGRVRGNSLFKRAGLPPQSFDHLISDDPTPDTLAAMDDEYERLFELLHDDVQREIVRYRLSGYRNGEIAERLGISLRSVERKLAVIRDAWSTELDQ